MATRPSVSVVVPFAGSAREAEATLAALGRLELAPGDELIVADNTTQGVVPENGRARVVRATELRSSYYARNVGAEAATREWVLFLDADCVPVADLLDRYFAEPLRDGVGAAAGEVLGAPGQDALTARYQRSRMHLRQEEILFRPYYRPMAVTANLLVRRRALDAVGGFHEGIRSGGDADFSWRLQDAGWRIEYRDGAEVEHAHRETLPQLARQAVRIGAGWAWARRRHPDYPFPSLLRRLARCVAGMVVWTLTGRFERAAFKALDAFWVTSESVGTLLPNAAPVPPPPEMSSPRSLALAVLVDQFPALTETFVAGEVRALERAGHRVRVEAASRADPPMLGGARGLNVSYWEDDGVLRKAGALLWLVARAPVGCLRDLADRRRWSGQEEVWPLRSLAPCARRLSRCGDRHLHAHFAAGAGLNALRLGRLLGLPYSVTVHAYDAFRHERNLREKLAGAAVATSVCQSTVAHLQQLAGPEVGARIHEVGMGIDGERFRRSRPYPGGRHVLGVGRLVPKKGFEHLLDAVARLEGDAPVELTLVGGGPLLDDLRARAARLGIESRVRFSGPLQHDEVAEAIESADLLVMPSVIAPDGDRDSLPVVVEEALALEVPVVASDLAGLPEVVRPEWGRLVPPGDVEALAGAIAEILALPPERRAKMGRAAREFILEHRDADREAARLAGLIAAAG